jgi:hypothetical protein
MPKQPGDSSQSEPPDTAAYPSPAIAGFLFLARNRELPYQKTDFALTLNRNEDRIVARTKKRGHSLRFFAESTPFDYVGVNAIT